MNGRSHETDETTPALLGLRTRRARRLLDLFLVGVSAPVWVPVVGGLCVLVRLLDGAPVFFKQTRLGRGEREFDALKLRTMTVDADDLLNDDGSTSVQRVTRLGGVLRRFGLDELPQIFNVVSGDMALVGPRAVPHERAETIRGVWRQRWLVRPGITGLAQVAGRNTIPWSRRLELDLEYVKTASVVNDLRILSRTLSALRSSGGFVPDRNPGEVDDISVHLGSSE